MSDMYRCMLNKQRERPGAARVPLEAYTGALTRYVRSRVRVAEPEPEPGASFVLFHADLVRSCGVRGVLAGSDPGDMWTVVSRHSEAWPDDADDDADKFVDQK